MRTIAIVLAAALAAAAEESTILHIYDVTTLTVKIVNFKGPPVGFTASGLGDGSDFGGIGIGVTGGEEEGTAIPGEDLKLLISQSVAPGTWDTPPNSIEYQDGSLIVRHTPEAQAGVKAFLAVIRSHMLRTVVVEAEVLDLAPGVLDIPAGVVLTEEQVKAVDAAVTDPAKGRRVASLRACGLNTQRFHAAALNQESYLRDSDIEIAERQAIADPVIGTRSTGYVIDVRPTLSPDASLVFLTVRFDAGEPLAMRTFEPGGKALGILEQPDENVSRTRTNLVVPAGRMALLSSSSFNGAQPGWTQVVLLRPGVQADTSLPFPDSKERLQVRLFDTRFILCDAGDFPGPRLGALIETDDSVGAGVTFESPDAEQGVTIGADQIENMIKRSIAPGSWNDASLALSGNRELFVFQSPENLKLVEGFLKRLTSERARLVSVDSWVLAMDDASWRDRRAALSGEIADATWTDLLAAAARGGAVRTVGTARAAGLNGTRFHTARGTVRAALFDYDVEIAQSASAYDPVMSVVAEGISLDVTPSSVGDGGQVQLDLRPTTVLAGELRSVSLQDKGVQVQAVELADFGVRTQVLVDAGRPTLVGVATRPKGAGTEVLVLFVKATVIDVK